MPDSDSPQLITTLPLTAEAREELLEKLFAQELPHHGELFVPGNSFYIHGTSHVQAAHMLKSLCHWLGIKPGYIGLEFESNPTVVSQGQRHSIFLESRVVKNELLLGAMLAHALVRFLLEERKQIHLLDANEQLSLVATGTIVFGLGIVTANALQPGLSHKQDHKNLLGSVPVSEYGAMLHGFLWQRAVPEHAYLNSLAPWTARLLGVKKAKKPILAIKQQYHTELQKRYQLVGLVWVALLSIGIGSFTLLQRVKPLSPRAQELQEQIVQLQVLREKCAVSVAYNKQYADMYDIQTERRINAEEMRCQSIQNELTNAEQSYAASQ
jgi:hypothetical protein